MPVIKRRSLVKPFKIHGGKDGLAKEIVQLFPPKCKTPNKPLPSDDGYLTFVDTYFGGGSVMLEHDPTGTSEIACDINKNLTNFWDVLRNPLLFDDLFRRLAMTPFSQEMFERVDWQLENGSPVGRAFAFFIKCRQSMSGRGKSFSPITKNRTRREMNEQVSAWLNAIEGLPDVHNRIKKILIVNSNGLHVSFKQNHRRTLEYKDPTYLADSRTAKNVYEHEMTYADHVDMLALQSEKFGKVDWTRYTLERPRSDAMVLLNIKYESRFVLSGYHSPLYDSFAEINGWRCVEFDVPNHAAKSEIKRRMIECVWMNY